MQHRALGKSGITVPIVGMGTWKTLDVQGAEAIAARRVVIDAAIDAGSTLFDTSPMYGESERVLAGALAGRRDGAIVATKVWTASPAEGREQIDRALAWYAGRVDLYQIHNLVAWREHLGVLEELRSAGAAGAIGATHYQRASFPELMRVMETGRIQQIQIPYNAADDEVEHEVLPLAAQLRLGVLVMRPLGAGALARVSPTADELEPLRPFGVTTWAQALLKWILSDERVHAVIPATSQATRARENAAAGEPPWLDEEARDYVSYLARAMA
ncbi:MAG: aldo/keto reductase [Gemmatimonadaceae bacterium]